MQGSSRHLAWSCTAALSTLADFVGNGLNIKCKNDFIAPFGVNTTIIIGSGETLCRKIALSSDGPLEYKKLIIIKRAEQ